MSELSQDARSLIEGAAHEDAPTAHDRARLKNKLALELGAAAFATGAVGIATAGTATAVATGSSSSAATGAATMTTAGATTTAMTTGGGILVTASKLAIAASVVGAIGTAAVIKLSPTERLDTPKSAQPAIAAPSAAQRVPQPVVLPVPTPTVEPLVTQAPTVGEPPVSQTKRRDVRASRPAKAVEANTAEASASTEPASADALSEELMLLARAQTALRDGRAQEALAHVREHERRFARGAMREERLGLEALAQCALGAGGEAVVRDFLRAAPASPLAARVREACGVK